MSVRVFMAHPKLPGRTISVRREAVKAYRRAGWVEAPEPPAPVPPAPLPTARPRRSRVSRKDRTT